MVTDQNSKQIMCCLAGMRISNPFGGTLASFDDHPNNEYTSTAMRGMDFSGVPIAGH